MMDEPAPERGPATVSDQDVVDAYQYMLSRWLVLRQEGRDLKEGFRWNEIIHRDVGGVAWANPNLDVAYSEAWIAVDGQSYALLELPRIEGRYYTFQLLNGWGEVVANINERNFPDHPHGTFALCLKGSNVQLPERAQRVELPGRTSRVLMRIELGADPGAAIALQRATTLRSSGTPDVLPPVEVEFKRFPGVDAFDRIEEILASEPDINEGMGPLQAKARAVAAAARDQQERERFARVIEERAIPEFMSSLTKVGEERGGWLRPRTWGNYGDEYVVRSAANFAGIWANTTEEVIYFGGNDFDGGRTYTQTFLADRVPADEVRYFWSVIAVDSETFRVMPNSLNRFLLNDQSGLQPNTDGSLTLWFAPERPEGASEPNWLPTPSGGKYNLTFRFYGPSADVIEGRYFPPPLVEQS